MNIAERLVTYAVDHPRTVTGVMVGLTIVLSLFIVRIKIDTDPENMLRKDEPVRVFNNTMKADLAIHDMVVIGIVDNAHTNGVFNLTALSNIYALTEYARTLQWPDPDNTNRLAGVVEVDLLSPSTVDNIEQAGPGAVKFEWLMAQPPGTEAEALAVRRKAERIPFLNGTIVSEDGRAIALYVAISSKDMSYRVARALQRKIDTFSGTEEYHITGMPVAQDTFGVEMFRQMAISAPLAMLIIFLLMWYFFRKIILIVAPMIVAMVSVMCTMGLLIALGFTVHIMSSMIPIFIMPMAVLDSVHIISEFFEWYQRYRDRRRTIIEVVKELFTPMLYTTLTTMAGFASLALTPIPPVQVFGVFIAFGMAVAWVFTMTFIPAFIMFIPERMLEGFGASAEHHAPPSRLSRALGAVGGFTYRRARLILVAAAVILAVSIYGITRIRINDNPVKWFTYSHPIRIADRVFNNHFGGTYMAYLALRDSGGEVTADAWRDDVVARARQQGGELEASVPGASGVFARVADEARTVAAGWQGKDAALSSLYAFADSRSADAPDELYDAWDEAAVWVSSLKQEGEIFKQPAVLNWMVRLQDYLLSTEKVGKVNSLADIVRTVYRELVSGQDKDFRIPDSSAAVAQSLFQYGSSHRPHDLWHFVMPDYKTASLWLQLKSGDNIDMSHVKQLADAWIRANPPPVELKANWFGLTYINVVWQKKMVAGMLNAFLGSFVVVFLMMTLLFRSSLWGFLSMIPLTVTIAFIYGAIGLVGKDYDMPVAVLSSLSLGLAVDFAIHFLARSRAIMSRVHAWRDAAREVFEEPARAIWRNVVVVAVGFLPLLAAPLVPYKTVGALMAIILAASGLATLLLLPALITLLERWLFPATRGRVLMCNCGTCIISGAAIVIAVAINVQQFFSVGWSTLSWISLVAVAVLAVVCRIVSTRNVCAQPSSDTETTEQPTV